MESRASALFHIGAAAVVAVTVGLPFVAAAGHYVAAVLLAAVAAPRTERPPRGPIEMSVRSSPGILGQAKNKREHVGRGKEPEQEKFDRPPL